ncbi:MAG: tyrosine-type recombinase/integrase [Pseudomonadota bacterium]
MLHIKKFTDVYVRNLKKTSIRYDITVGNGFCLRVSITGKKSWVYSYKFNGESKRFALGHYPSVGVAEAQKLFSDAFQLKDKGIDPKQHEIDAKQAILKEQSINIETIEWLANEFYTRYIIKNRKVPKQIKQIIDADIIPSWGSLKLEEITTRQITLGLEEIVDRGANVQANKVLSTMKQMLNYAVSKGITERNPALLIKSKNIGGDKKPRDRVLTMDEIKLVWKWLSNPKNNKIHPATILALKILLLTGARTNEIRLSEWKQINFDNALWTIPKEKYKTGIVHKVHLTQYIKKHFSDLKALSSCEYVLPSKIIVYSDNGTPIYKPLTDKALPRAVKRIQGLITNDEGVVQDIAPWTPHDLRRTFRSQMGEISILPHILEACLGHKPPIIQATYSYNEYLPERKEALELWSKKIEELVSTSNTKEVDKAIK